MGMGSECLILLMMLRNVICWENVDVRGMVVNLGLGSGLGLFGSVFFVWFSLCLVLLFLNFGVCILL